MRVNIRFYAVWRSIKVRGSLTCFGGLEGDSICESNISTANLPDSSKCWRMVVRSAYSAISRSSNPTTANCSGTWTFN